MCLDQLLLEAEEERVEKENHERQQAEQVAAGKKHDVPKVYWNVTSPSLPIYRLESNGRRKYYDVF